MKPLVLILAAAALTISAANSQAQASVDIRKDANGQVLDTTEHYVAPPPRTRKVSSREASIARGMAYQPIEFTSGYNHDGLAFQGLSAIYLTGAKDHAKEVADGYLSTTVYEEPFAFANVDCSGYYRNIKAGKWKKFENGEEPPLVKFFGKRKEFENGEEPPLAKWSLALSK
jgi:hypothetical protein